MKITVERWNIALVTKAWVFVIGLVHDKDDWFWACDVIPCVTDSTGKITLAEEDDTNGQA